MRRRFLRDTRGAAAAEMALVLPGIAFILANITDVSIYLYSRMQVELAAQEAVGAARVECDKTAELPATKGTNCPALTTKMRAAAQSTSLGANISMGSPAEAYFCATSSGSLTQVAAATATTVPANCAATVATSTAKPGIYITVPVSYTFTPVFPGATVAAMLPSTITRSAWMRLG